MLAAILDRHSQIAVTPETHFFNVLAKIPHSGLSSCHGSLMGSFYTQFTRVRDLGLNDSELESRFRNYPPDFPHLFRSILEQYLHQSGKSCVAEKTPSQLFATPAILSWYPHAKIICIVRDGRDAVLSAKKTKWDSSTQSRWLALGWRVQARLAIQFEEQYPDRFLRVHYEKILQDPVEEVSRINHFVGTRFEAQQLDPSNPTAVVPKWEEAWKGNVNRSLDAGRAFAWKETLSGPKLWHLTALMQPYLRGFDYPEVEAEVCPPALRVALNIQSRVFLKRNEASLLARIQSRYERLCAYES